MTDFNENKLAQLVNKTLPEYDTLATERSEAEPLSHTVLDLDDWSCQRGKAWASGEEAQAVFGEDAISAATDFLALAWEPCPVMAKNPADKRRESFINTLMQTAEYKEVHKSTMLNQMTASMAAMSYGMAFTSLSKKEEPEDELDKDAMEMAAVKEAVKDASKEVQEANSIADALGLGDGEGSSFDLNAMGEAYEAIHSNEQLHKIMQAVGKYMRMAKSQQRNKKVHGCDEVTGITLSDDVNKLLGSELAWLSDEDMENEFYRRFTTKSLFVRNMESFKDEEQGPMVVCIDESGSMDGDRIVNAKAMALAMAWIAEKQNRWCCLVGWSSATQQNTLVIEPGKKDRKALLEWLGHFYAGGTRLGSLTNYLKEHWDKVSYSFGKTDVVLVTDASVHITDEDVDSYNTWKEQNSVKHYSIVVSSAAGEVDKISDQSWLSSEMSLESSGVAEVLGL